MQNIILDRVDYVWEWFIENLHKSQNEKNTLVTVLSGVLETNRKMWRPSQYGASEQESVFTSC